MDISSGQRSLHVGGNPNAMPTNREYSKKPSIYSYISISNPIEVDRLLYDNGYSNPFNMTQRVSSLYDMVRKQGDQAKLKIAEIHPDKEIFKEIFEKYGKLNCEGCDKCNNTEKANFTGDGLKTTPTPINNINGMTGGMSEKTVNTIIIAGSLMVTAILLSVVVTSIAMASKKA